MLKKVHSIRRFNRFYTRFLGLLNERLLDCEVSLAEGRILFEIDRLHDCKAKELIEVLGIDRGHLSRILARLEKAGYIRRETDQQDKRARTLRLTPKGDRILAEINRRATSQIEGILQSLSANEQTKLVDAMGEIENILGSIGS